MFSRTSLKTRKEVKTEIKKRNASMTKKNVTRISPRRRRRRKRRIGIMTRERTEKEKKRRARTRKSE